MSTCPTCGQRIPQWRLSAWWMNDNHTFVRLTGTPEEMAEQARKACAEYGSGMLPPPRWVDDEAKTERSVSAPHVHSTHGTLPARDLKMWICAVTEALALGRPDK